MGTPRTITSKRAIHCAPESALASFYDHEAFIKLNELVASIEKLPSDNAVAKYRITDKKAFLGVFSVSTKYNVSFQHVSQGMDCEVEASLGIRLRNHWRARQIEEGVTEVEETVQVDVSYYISSTWHITSTPHN